MSLIHHLNETFIRDIAAIVAEYGLFQGYLKFSLRMDTDITSISLTAHNTIAILQEDGGLKVVSLTSGVITDSLPSTVRIRAMITYADMLILGLMDGHVLIKRGEAITQVPSKSTLSPTQFLMVHGNLIIARIGGELEVWDLQSEQIIHHGETEPIRSMIAFGSYIAILGIGGNITLWDWRQASSKLHDIVDESSVMDLRDVTVLSVDNDLLLVGYLNGNIERVDSDGTVITRFVGHTRAITALGVLEDGEIASGSGDHTLKIWERNGTVRMSLEQYCAVTDLVVLPYNQLITGCADGAVRSWE